MPLTAAGSGISLAEQHVADMLAASSAFQSFAGVDDATAAAARIHFDSLPPPEHDNGLHSPDELTKYRPFALVFTAENSGYRLRRAATGCYAESGQIVLHLEDNVPENLAHNAPELMRRFKNTLGAIVEDLTSLAYQAGYLAINDLDVLLLAREAEDAIPQNGDNVFALLNLHWGSQ